MANNPREYSFTDNLINYLINKTSDSNKNFNKKSKSNFADQSIPMLRVNHSGEVCAQALYSGQAMMANSIELKKHLTTAAKEEEQHLSWCHNRLQELGGQTSLLNPIWYMGSYAIGVLSGSLGDKWSLGFVAETEHQVTEHLDKQLLNLPSEDSRSREIIEQMRQDELQHATSAIEKGGIELPFLVKAAMRCTAKIMTTVAAYI